MQFEERDVAADFGAVRELIGKYQSRITPTIVVDEEVIIGFDPERLNQALGL